MGINFNEPTGGGSAGPVLLSNGNIFVGVDGVATALKGLNLVLGSDGESSPGMGAINQTLVTSGSATCTTGTYGNCAVRSLTVGVWKVWATLTTDSPAPTATGFEAQLYVKNAVTNVPGFDYVYYTFPTGGSGMVTFAERVVIIASADASKQVIAKARSIGATQDISGYVYATRVG